MPGQQETVKLEGAGEGPGTGLDLAGATQVSAGAGAGGGHGHGRGSGAGAGAGGGGQQRTEYRCTICNKTVTRYAHLARHVRIHSGAKPHSCLVCGRSFGRKDNLARHLRCSHNIVSQKPARRTSGAQPPDHVLPPAASPTLAHQQAPSHPDTSTAASTPPSSLSNTAPPSPDDHDLFVAGPYGSLGGIAVDNGLDAAHDSVLVPSGFDDSPYDTDLSLAVGGGVGTHGVWPGSVTDDTVVEVDHADVVFAHHSPMATGTPGGAYYTAPSPASASASASASAALYNQAHAYSSPGGGFGGQGGGGGASGQYMSPFAAHPQAQIQAQALGRPPVTPPYDNMDGASAGGSPRTGGAGGERYAQQGQVGMQGGTAILLPPISAPPTSYAPSPAETLITSPPWPSLPAPLPFMPGMPGHLALLQSAALYGSGAGANGQAQAQAQSPGQGQAQAQTQAQSPAPSAHQQGSPSDTTTTTAVSASTSASAAASAWYAAAAQAGQFAAVGHALAGMPVPMQVPMPVQVPFGMPGMSGAGGVPMSAMGGLGVHMSTMSGMHVPMSGMHMPLPMPIPMPVHVPMHVAVPDAVSMSVSSAASGAATGTADYFPALVEHQAQPQHHPYPPGVGGVGGVGGRDDTSDEEARAAAAIKARGGRRPGTVFAAV